MKENERKKAGIREKQMDGMERRDKRKRWSDMSSEMREKGRGERERERKRERE